MNLVFIRYSPTVFIPKPSYFNFLKTFSSQTMNNLGGCHTLANTPPHVKLSAVLSLIS